MKTIQEYVEQGMPRLADLQDALRLAMQLEFATIPPYLCAQWSIKNDPDRVEAVIHRIVGQEMYHMALAGNILTAIGGVPQIANAHFIPRYPLHTLPGGIEQVMPVDLHPLTPGQIEVFMQVELPSFPPVAFLAEEKSPATIGEFYDEIIKSLEKINPPIVPDAFAVPVPNVRAIENIRDAIELVRKIQIEGEGMPDSPEQPPGDRLTVAHYYSFKELHVKRRLVHDGQEWHFCGSHIRLPEVFQFDTFDDRSAVARDFSRTLTRLLIDLQSCWDVGAPPNIAAMFQLRILGRLLIENGIRPNFVWDLPTQQAEL